MLVDLKTRGFSFILFYFFHSLSVSLTCSISKKGKTFQKGNAFQISGRDKSAINCLISFQSGCFYIIFFWASWRGLTRYGLHCFCSTGARCSFLRAKCQPAFCYALLRSYLQRFYKAEVEGSKLQADGWPWKSQSIAASFACTTYKPVAGLQSVLFIPKTVILSEVPKESHFPSTFFGNDSRERRKERDLGNVVW